MSTSLKRIASRNFTKCRSTGKRRYKTYAEAYQEYERIRNHPKGKPPIDFYRCEACGGYHLTTQGKTQEEQQ